MASSATSILGKRQHDGTRDLGESSTSYPRLYYHYILEPESSCPSEEDTESVHSIQDKTTDSAKDTPDTSTTEDEEEVDDEEVDVENSFSDDVHLSPEEYEPRSLSDSEIRHPFTVNESFSTSSNDDDIMIKNGKIMKAITENTSSTSTFSSDDTPERIDPELSLTDYWYCVKCRTPNNNPLFRFCEKCFGDRKNFFPPRPKPRTKKRKQRTRRRTKKMKSSGGTSSSTSQQSSFPSSSTSTENVTNSTLKGSLSSNASEVENVSADSASSKTLNSRSITCQTESSEQWPLLGEMCETCMARPKDGVFIHTKIVHRYSCYRCSKKIWKEIGRCPLCNNKVCNVKKIAG